MPRKAASKGAKAVNINQGTAIPSALRGGDTNKWDVSGEATQRAEAQMDKSEPFLQAPFKGQETAWPTIYGIDLKEKRRQNILEDAAANKYGNRTVVFDDKTVDWIIREQDRIYFIERDMIFEASAKTQKLFDNPAGLEYLHKINPGYFQRRRKMAKWLVKTQLKLFDIFMNGVQNEADFDFMLMIQALPAPQMRLLNTAAHRLMELNTNNEEGLYQKGAVRKAVLPEVDLAAPYATQTNRQVPFAGVTSDAWGGPIGPNGASGMAAIGPSTAFGNLGMRANNYAGVDWRNKLFGTWDPTAPPIGGGNSFWSKMLGR